MTIRSLIACAILLAGFAGAAHADDLQVDDEDGVSSQSIESAQPSDRLLIVNGNTGHVIYDDGQNDMFCVTRKVYVHRPFQWHRTPVSTIACR